MRKRVFACLGLLAATTVGMPQAQAHFTGCDSTDSGEIRWGGSTTYTDARSHGNSQWNGLGSINIAPDAWNTIEDLTWSDANRSDVTWAGVHTCYSCCATDTIQLNVYYMSGFTTSQRRNVATHELGHALGIGHSYSGQVMYEYVSSVTTLQSHDISDYRSLWG